MRSHLWSLTLGLIATTTLSSCSPPLPAAPQGHPNAAEADALTAASEIDPRSAAIVEAIDRRINESIALLRDSAVALEYAGAESPNGTRRVATGVVVSHRGDVLSIRIDPPKQSSPILARDASGGRHPVHWVATDVETGLTLLRIDPSIAKPVRPCVRQPKQGNQVLILGNPFGLRHSVIRGQISGLDRRVDVGLRPLGGLIQIDASLHPGDSGALVADLRGEWIGLIRSGLATLEADGEVRTFDHNLGFAIPAVDALWIAEQLGQRKRVDRAYLGVRLNLDPVDHPTGAILDGVVSDSPADQAGLQAGDRVVAFDDYAIHSASDLTDRLDRTLANSDATLVVVRGSRSDRYKVHTSKRPPLVPTPPRTTSSKRPDDEPTSTRDLEKRLETLEKQLKAFETADPEHP